MIVRDIEEVIRLIGDIDIVWSSYDTLIIKRSDMLEVAAANFVKKLLDHATSRQVIDCIDCNLPLVLGPCYIEAMRDEVPSPGRSQLCQIV